MDGPAAFRTLLTDVRRRPLRPRSTRRGFRNTPKVRCTLWDALFEFFTLFQRNSSQYCRQGRAACALARHGNGAHSHRKAQQYLTSMPTLFPGKLATQETPYDSHAALSVAFVHLKHNTSLAIDGDAFSPASQGLSSLTHHVAASSVSPVTSPYCNTRRFGCQDSTHGVPNVSLTHSRRDPFAVDYGL